MRTIYTLIFSLIVAAICPVAAQERDESLPNVLIIGSELSQCYTPFVQQALSGRANVYHIPESSQNSDYAVDMVEWWLNGSGVSWDVIHVNIGLWDIMRTVDPAECDVPAERYKSNMSNVVSKIINSTSAQIIWATTIAVPEGGELPYKAGDEVLYNGLVDEVLSNFCGAIIDDQYFTTRENPQIRIAGSIDSLTTEGYELLAKGAAISIREALDDMGL